LNTRPLRFLGGLLVGEVDDREVDLLVLLRSGLRGVTEQEADRGDGVAALGHERLDVVGVLRVGLGLDLTGLHTQVGRGSLQSVVGSLVERLVVEAAGVGDHACLEVDLVDRRRFLSGRGGLGVGGVVGAFFFCGLAATGGESECSSTGKRCDTGRLLHGTS
jgi:hypothetical protein